MTTFEDRLRVALDDLAEEARSAPLLQRLDEASAAVTRRPRWVTVAATAAAAVAIGTCTALLIQWERGPVIEPAQHPPKVFRLSKLAVTAPGRAQVAVTLPGIVQAGSGGNTESRVHLLPEGRDAAVHLRPSRRVPISWSQHLSPDGTHVVRQVNEPADLRLEIVNLITGHRDDVGGHKGYCPHLSPANDAVATYTDEHDVQIIDLDRSTARQLNRAEPNRGMAGFPCTTIGWSPDGKLLAAGHGTGTAIYARHGNVQRALPGRTLVNASMSWAPDGRSVLLYDRATGTYVLAAVDGTAETVLRVPTEGKYPAGWAGDRIVWLAGEPGSYRLLSSDQEGEDVRTWMRFDIGDAAIGSVSWSSALSGDPTG